MPQEVRVPAAAGLLQAWERGRPATPARRALLMLAATCPDTPIEILATMPVGMRNRLLLSGYRMLFGPECDAVAECLHCGSALEAQIPLAGLLAAPPAAADDGQSAAGQERELVAAGHRVRYRLVTAGDLAELTLADPARLTAPGSLLRRCLLDVCGEDPDVSLNTDADLPAEVTDALAEALAAADPDAVLSVQVGCPDCGRASDLPFDPVAFLWAEVDDWAWDLLGDVHELAAAYGWDEGSILALSPWRRNAYLTLVAADAARREPAVAGRP